MTGSHPAVQSARIVARYADGRVVKGRAVNFSPTRPAFLLQVEGSAQPTTVQVGDLKAVFFVRDLAGNPAYDEIKQFEGKAAGRKVVVTFADGERIVGTTMTYSADRDWFFLFPADPRSNNERIYVPIRAIVSIENAP